MKHLPLVLIALLYSAGVWAQNFVGYSSDNYSGIHQALVNPALLVDSPRKIDINLVSVGASLATDYTPLTYSNISDIANSENLSGTDTNPKDDNRAWIYADILGPSFFFKLDKKSAIGFVSRLRALGDFENISGELLESAINGFPLISFSFSQEDLNFQTHPFAEFGLTYSRVVYDQDRLRLKAGATLKYLIGGGVAQGFSESLAGRYSLFTGNLSLDGDFAYQYALQDEVESLDDVISNGESGVGFDLGFVLDIKPKEWENSGFTRVPYKWRIGLAFNDLGSVTYGGAEDNRYSFDNIQIDGGEFEEDLEQALDGFEEETSIRDLSVSLPSSLRVTVDYHIMDNFFANLDIQQNLVSEDGPFARALNRATITPRWEARGIGVYLPLSLTEFAEGHAGLAVRLGPLFIGSHTLFNQIFHEDARIANAYVGLKIPINHKKIVPNSN